MLLRTDATALVPIVSRSQPDIVHYLSCMILMTKASSIYTVPAVPRLASISNIFLQSYTTAELSNIPPVLQNQCNPL
jgi:hypothetical protein